MKKALFGGLLLLLCLAPPAAAFDGGALAPVFMEDEQYTESWFFYFQFEGGWRVFSMVMLTNVGPGTNKPSFNCSVVAPEGAAKIYEGRHQPAELQYRAEPFRLAMGKSFLAWEGGRLHYHLEESGVRLDFLLTPQVVGFFPLRRFLLTGQKGGEYQVAVPLPRAAVSGTIEVNSRAVQVNGIGYFEHSRTNRSLIFFAERISRLIIWRETETISALLVETNKGTALSYAFCFPGALETQVALDTLRNDELPAWELAACGAKYPLRAARRLQEIKIFENLNYLERTALSLVLGQATARRYEVSGGGSGVVEIMEIK